MYQTRLLSFIQKRLGPKESIIEVLSRALDISYDAAHRRVSLKSKFSIEETARLSQYFSISLDQIFQSDSHVLVKKTKEIDSFEGLTNYLEQSMAALQSFHGNSTAALFYSAKDIPLFYMLGADQLSKFKMFVWMDILGIHSEEINYEQFKVKMAIQDQSDRMKDFYSDIQKHEIWNDTTINSTLQQITYFFHAGLLQLEEGLALCESLKDLICALEQQCVPSNEKLQLYYHELLILNNNVLLSSQNQQALFVPYTMLGYFITTDTDTCQHSHSFFQQQIKNSMLLNKAGTRDRKMFFNRLYQKVDYYKSQIKIL